VQDAVQRGGASPNEPGSLPHHSGDEESVSGSLPHHTPLLRKHPLEPRSWRESYEADFSPRIRTPLNERERECERERARERGGERERYIYRTREGARDRTRERDRERESAREGARERAAAKLAQITLARHLPSNPYEITLSLYRV